MAKRKRRRRRSWYRPGLALQHGVCCPLEVHLPPAIALLSLPRLFSLLPLWAGTVTEFHLFFLFSILFLSLKSSLGFDRGEDKSLEQVEIAQQEAVNKYVIESPRRKHCLSDRKFH